MKAVEWTAYGAPEVLRLIETDTPEIKDNEVLIKVCSSTVSIGDARMRSFDVPLGFWLPTRLMLGLFKPRFRIAGMDFSGVIESVGAQVTKFQVGDEVFGTTGMQMGANAEYVALRDDGVFVRKPDYLTHDEAVAIPFGGLTAIHFLKHKAGVSRGQQVLINGASGAVGTTSVQLARHLGAEVTGVCSGGNAELVRGLGAGHVIDYTREDVLQSQTRYDAILDTVGNLPLSRCKKLLKSGGKLIAINADLRTNLAALFRSDLISGVAGENLADLEYLRDLAEQGHITPVIDRVFTLDEIVEAHRYVDSGHKRGNVVLSVEPRA
jgi:NADPH:quinone reductase-like Zn-dependent oxidoreductase